MMIELVYLAVGIISGVQSFVQAVTSSAAH